ncbi:unnamed protein product [Paramecium sonneborni]|uniref:Uncharacterized protein n=1 Tax=Paramecium sonneborni TaxID=65129 RepID=A0A8S1P496_9CILI|nr:unnamed protein product [Paramecium sonneborni]
MPFIQFCFTAPQYQMQISFCILPMKNLIIKQFHQPILIGIVITLTLNQLKYLVVVKGQFSSFRKYQIYVIKFKRLLIQNYIVNRKQSPKFNQICCNFTLIFKGIDLWMIDDECINVYVTGQQSPFKKCLYPKSNHAFGKSVNCENNINENYQLRLTEIIQTTSQSENIQIKIWSNANEDLNNESYSFSNIQLFINRCYKTCKTCSGERENQCLSCYPGIFLSNTYTCNSCKELLNQQFLHRPEGCKNKFEEDYGFDQDLVCNEDILSPFRKMYKQMPIFPKVEGANCLNSIDILKKQNLRIIELMKEFHDLSTTNNQILKLFITWKFKYKFFKRQLNLFQLLMKQKNIWRTICLGRCQIQIYLQMDIRIQVYQNIF